MNVPWPAVSRLRRFGACDSSERIRTTDDLTRGGQALNAVNACVNDGNIDASAGVARVPPGGCAGEGRGVLHRVDIDRRVVAGRVRRYAHDQHPGDTDREKRQASWDRAGRSSPSSVSR